LDIASFSVLDHNFKNKQHFKYAYYPKWCLQKKKKNKRKINAFYTAIQLKNSASRFTSNQPVTTLGDKNENLSRGGTPSPHLSYTNITKTSIKIFFYVDCWTLASPVGVPGALWKFLKIFEMPRLKRETETDSRRDFAAFAFSAPHSFVRSLATR